MERLAALLNDAPMDEIRTKWSQLSAKSLLRLAPKTSKLRTDPCAVDHVPQGGRLREEDYLVLLHYYRPAEDEVRWAEQALELFHAVDLRGEGSVEWSDFASFVLAQDMSRPPGGLYLETDTERKAELVGVRAPRTYGLIPGGVCSWTSSISKLVYLPPPVHKVAAFPTHQRDNVMIISADHPPRRQSGMLKHHTAYREHVVLDCVAVTGTEICVTSSSLAGVRSLKEHERKEEMHFLTMWRVVAQGMPALVHRRETPDPQATLCHSQRSDRLYTGGPAHGYVYEWSFDDPPRLDEDLPEWKQPPAGPVALVRCRVLVCHTFGLTYIKNLERRLDDRNLLATASSDGTLHVWLSGFDPGTDDATVGTNNTAMTDISADRTASIIPRPARRRAELEPLARLAAQTAGSAVLAYSDTHELLFSAGRKPAHGEYDSGSILVWDVSNAESKMRLQTHATMAKHEARVCDLLNLPDEARLLSSDVSGMVIVWSLPGLVPQQTFAGGCYIERVPAYGDAPKLEAGKEDGCVIYGGGPLKAFRRSQPAVKEGLLHAYYDAAQGTFICGSAHRVCVWDGSTGKMRSQVGMDHLLQNDIDDDEAPQLRERKPIIKGFEPKYEVPATGAPIARAGPSGEAVAYSISNDGRTLAVADARGGVHVCVLPAGGHAPRRTKQLDPHATSCSSVHLVEACHLVVSGGLDGLVAIADEALPDGYVQATDGLRGRSARLRDVRVERTRTVASPAGSDSCDSPLSQRSDDASHMSPVGRGSFLSSFASSPISPAATESGAFVGGQARHEVLCCIADAGLSLIASISRSSADPREPFVCLWDFELLGLVGTCSPPQAQRVTAISFVRPYPCLVGATATGALHLWRVPECCLVASLTFGAAPVAAPGAFLTEARALATEASFGAISATVVENGAALGAGSDEGTCVVWFLDETFFADASLARNALTKRNNYNPRRQAHPVVEWGELRRSRRLSRVTLGGGDARVDEAARHASEQARCWQAHAGALTSVQVVRRPEAVVTASDDGLARIWSWAGELIGLLDVNAPEGNGMPWRFRTAAFVEAGGDGDARDALRAAKKAAAFYAGLQSRATRDERQVARTAALRKLRAGTDEGLEDLASFTLSRTQPPRSPVSTRKATLEIADVSEDQGWARAAKQPMRPWHRPDWRPDDAPPEKGWDAVFGGIAALEASQKLASAALVPPKRRRRPARGPSGCGKTWKTKPSLIDLSYLALELPAPPRPGAVTKPRPHGRVKSLRERVVDRRDQTRPRTLPADPAEGFADSNPNPVARMMRLAHMGY